MIKLISLLQERTRPLATLMIHALGTAYEMQSNNEPFRQIDIQDLMLAY